jgi:predicted Fe-Mo cluster-binding NifX family protein
VIIIVNLIGGIPISENLFSKGLEIAKARAKLVRSVINAAISTLKKYDTETDI